jgi:hypothetical protein
MGALHIILKVGHPMIISTQISEQKILMWFLSHNIPKRNKLAEKISQKKQVFYLVCIYKSKLSDWTSQVTRSYDAYILQKFCKISVGTLNLMAFTSLCNQIQVWDCMFICPDLINPWLLKEAVHQLKCSLYKLFNLSLSIGVLLSDWKKVR